MRTDVKRTSWFLSLTLLAAGLAALGLACAGLSKPELEARLLALEKNAPLRAFPIERRSARCTVAGAQRELEFSWIHLPGRAGAPARPLVFVHGTPSTFTNWSALLHATPDQAPLVGECDVFLLDVVGHGQARARLPAYDFQACADFVHAFLDLLDLRDVTLVGQSYGGEFAWRAALDAPERVRKLVLIDSSGYRRPDDAWLPEEVKLRTWPGATLGFLLNSRDRLRPALQLHFAEPIDPDQLEEMYLCCDNGENWQAMTELCRDENGTREREIPSLRARTLLVWGARDIAYPLEREGRRFEREIPGARLVAIDAGHYPHEERPLDVRRALHAFHFED